MEEEQINKDFELIKSLYFGNHIDKKDFQRLKIVILSLKQALEIRQKD